MKWKHFGLMKAQILCLANVAVVDLKINLKIFLIKIHINAVVKKAEDINHKNMLELCPV